MSARKTTSPLLEFAGISKSFPGVRALQNVNFTLRPGETHALIGENGAGKSTLLKILFGIYQPDAGVIRLNGQQIAIHNPRSANQAGIHMIHQELQQVPELTAAQNIFLGQPLTSLKLFKNSRQMGKVAQQLLKRLDVEIDVQMPVRKLSIAQRQLVEIARALRGNTRILAMDEPTSSLAPVEFENLTHVINELKAEGVGIIFISHRLNEIFRVADRVTVLRDGAVVGEAQIQDVTQDTVVRMMVGRKLDETSPHAAHIQADVLVKARNLSWRKQVKHVSFELHRGEILGVAGLVGAGRTELARVLAGVSPPDSGEIELRGQPVKFRTPRDAIRVGIGLLPEDRKKQGLIKLMSILSNVSLPILKQFTRGGLITRKARRHKVGETVNQVNLRPPQIDRPIQYFSGGNQQKAIISRWLCANSEVLIFDEPTRGIDVGAKHEIYGMMEELAAAGKGILMISSELPEILRLSDRVLVMRNGQLMTTLRRDELSEEVIMRYATASAKPDTEPDRLDWQRLEDVFGPLLRPAKPIRMGGVVKTLVNEYWQLLAQGYRMAGEQYNVTVDIQAAKDETDQAGQLAIAEAMLTLNYDTLLVSPQTDANLQPAFDKALAQGAPFINVNDAIFPGAVSYIGPVQSHNGAAVAQWFCAHHPAGGKVAVIAGPAGVYAVGQRTEGFLATLRKQGAGKFEVVAIAPGNWDRQQAYQQAAAILQQHPDLLGFYCNNDVMALGVTAAVKAAQALDRIAVFGTDGSDSAYQSIAAHELTGTVDLFPVLTGAIAVEVALRLLAGQTLPRVIVTPQALVTHANYDRYPRANLPALRAVLRADALKNQAESMTTTN